MPIYAAAYCKRATAKRLKNRARLHRRFLFLLLSGLLVGGAANNVKSETLPVLWSQSLDLNSLDQLEHRLQQPLWRGTGITVAQKWRFIGAGKAPEPIAAKVICPAPIIGKRTMRSIKPPRKAISICSPVLPEHAKY